MTVILNASTTQGLVLTSDTSGNVAIQSNGANAITIDNTQNLSIASGNLTFNGTAQRITGDFSNATAASRVMVQTSTANGATTFGIIPNGTNDVANFMALNNSSDQANASYFQFRIGSGESRIRSDVNGTGTQLPMTFYVGGSERLRIKTDGEVLVAGTTDQGAYNLQVAGTGVWGAGAYVNGSDARIKNDIAPLDSGLDVVAKLNPVTYKYKEDWSKDQSIQTGFIAQELLTALEGKNYVDGVVQQGGEYMSVAYQNIIPILTKAIQELSAKVDEQAKEIEILKGAK